MISVLFNWLYILFTTTTLGYGFSKFVCKKLNYRITRFDSIVGIGLIIATVYAQFFSLFYKVGLWANVILLVSCITLVFVFRRDFFSDMKRSFTSMSLSKKVVIALLILFWAYFTSRGFFHYDSDLYHGQSIRWIEEYGIVKGLGNLHVRFAYNSSLFAVSALYSMKFLVGQSLHGVNGFIALMLSISILDIMDSFKRKKFLLSDYARIGAVYYLNIVFDEIVSPASDLATMCALFYIVIKWFSLLEKEEKNIAPYALLCVGGVYTVSLKLTAGLILLLVIKPLYMLIREKRGREIALYLSMGAVVLLPWLIRNVIISGYPVYPLPELDLFPVSWKIAPEVASLDSAEIKVWGRALYDITLVDLPFTEWFGNWFTTTLTSAEKLFILADYACIILAAILAIYTVIKKKWNYLDYLLVIGTMLASFAFWQLSAPLIRYGYAYVLLLIVSVLGVLKMAVKFDQIIYWSILALGTVKLVLILRYAYNFVYFPTYVWQQDYGTYEVLSYEIEGETFYYPASGDKIGYDAFPSSPTPKELEFYGDNIKDGFWMKY